MRILITGASGLVGSAIVGKFIENKIKVAGLVHKSSNNIRDNNYIEFRLDLLSEKLQIKNDFNFIIHSAALTPDQNYTDEQLFEANQCIDKKVIDFAKINQSNIIYFSTAYMYDKSTSLLDENSRLQKKLKGYYRSKEKTESIIRDSLKKFLIFRISSPYGNLTKQKNVIKNFADRINSGLDLILFNSGKRIQNFIHIDDIAEACFRCINLSKDGLFNLTYKYNYSMLDLAKFLISITNSESKIVFDNSLPDSQPNVNFCNEKLINALNWEPQIDLKEGIVKTLKYENRNYFRYPR